MPITRVFVVGLLHEAQRFALTAWVFILVFFYVYFFTEHPFRANPRCTNTLCVCRTVPFYCYRWTYDKSRCRQCPRRTAEASQSPTPSASTSWTSESIDHNPSSKSINPSINQSTNQVNQYVVFDNTTNLIHCRLGRSISLRRNYCTSRGILLRVISLT